MALAEVTCGSCGAINRASAETCWRCLEPIDRPVGVEAGSAPRAGTIDPPGSRPPPGR